jgi:hypothetical protein
MSTSHFYSSFTTDEGNNEEMVKKMPGVPKEFDSIPFQPFGLLPNNQPTFLPMSHDTSALRSLRRHALNNHTTARNFVGHVAPMDVLGGGKGHQPLLLERC